MVKKLLVIFILVVCLNGCAKYSDNRLEAELNEYLENIDEKLDISTNSKLSHYSFYLPSDMVINDCIDENVVLGYGESSMVMNINIISIVNSHYYSNYRISDEGYFDDEKLIYSKTGTYMNQKEITENYFLNIYEGDPYFKIHFMSDSLNIYAYSLKEECIETSKHMVLVARTANVDIDTIVNEYSQVDIISYQRKQVDLFQQKIPKSGLLTEMLKDE